MRRRVYLETSVVSYLAALPSRDLIVAARQAITREWWRHRRPLFDIYVSQLVLDEARGGDRDAAGRRAACLTDIPLLDVSASAVALARRLLDDARLPPNANADALHIAIAAVHGIDFLVTWNSTHIANAELRPRVERSCRAQGYEPPALCTPDELMGEEDDD